MKYSTEDLLAEFIELKVKNHGLKSLNLKELNEYKYLCDPDQYETVQQAIYNHPDFDGGP